MLLAVGGLLASAVLTALYGLVRDADPLFALWALALGLLSQLGALIVGPKAQALGAANTTPEEYGVIQQRLIFLARIELVGFLAIFTCMILMRFGL